MTAPTLTQLRGMKTEIEALAAQCGLTNLRVFGSVARGSAQVQSDLDMLVTVQQVKPFGCTEFKLGMEGMLHCPVDVISDKFIRPALRQAVFQEAIPL